MRRLDKVKVHIINSGGEYCGTTTITWNGVSEAIVSQWKNADRSKDFPEGNMRKIRFNCNCCYHWTITPQVILSVHWLL